MNERQRIFLEQLAQRIPRLFDAIGQGNIKSEFIIGVRHIDKRQVRLKLVAEVVDPGANPLATHSTYPYEQDGSPESAESDATSAVPASRRRRPRKR